MIRTTDPIIGKISCVVSAIDNVAGLRFSQTGGLHAVVQNSTHHGLLVGVSSGGRFRLPTGDIVWRVDDRPYRELKATDNPPPAGAPAMIFPVPPGTSDAAVAAMQQTIATALQATAGMTATSTVATGGNARDGIWASIEQHGQGRTDHRQRYPPDPDRRQFPRGYRYLRPQSLSISSYPCPHRQDCCCRHRSVPGISPAELQPGASTD